MSKLLKIFVSVAGLALVYLWLASFFQSCGNKSDQSTDDIAMVDEISPGEEDIIDVSDEDFFEEDAGTSEIAGNENSFEELEEQLVEEPESKPVPRSTSSVTSSGTQSGSSGAFLLISGNYLVKSNAEEMVRKLKNLGYSNAEVVVFDRSQYHTVIASRFSSYESALQSESKLKQKGVDCYVKRKS